VTIAEYLDLIKERLTTERAVSTFRISRERATLTDGYLRARLTLTDDSQLEFSEYVQRSTEGQIVVVTYNYHWFDMRGNLIRRWDNTPHFPDLPGFPHHVHIGADETPGPGHPVSILSVLDEIAPLVG
jgi:Family of unknown function (DUF6516)